MYVCMYGQGEVEGLGFGDVGGLGDGQGSIRGLGGRKIVGIGGGAGEWGL